MKTAKRLPKPEFLPGATDFSEDDEHHSLWVIETMKAHPEFWAPLRKAEVLVARSKSHDGRKRLPGSYALAYLAFVNSATPNVHPWWKKGAGHSIWRAAGFRDRPSYITVQRRFAELDESPIWRQAFEETARNLIRHAVEQSGGRVGQYVHIDGSEAETNARLEHLCPIQSPCRRRAGKASGKPRGGGKPDAYKESLVLAMQITGATAEPHEREPEPDAEDDRALAGAPALEPREGHGVANGRDVRRAITAGLSINAVRDRRHQRADEPEPEGADLQKLDLGEADSLAQTSKGAILTVGTCQYRVLDETAGVRAYTDGRGNAKRFWVGFYCHKMVDHFTGGALAVHFSSASVNEAASYPAIFEKLVAATGKNPIAVAGDKGYSVSSVFEFNTRRGVASIFPWRKRRLVMLRELEDTDLWDRHGVVRCKHCGSPTRFVRFSHTDPRGPRLWVRCSAGNQTPACANEQTIMCKQHWRLLLPLWRTDPVYMALRHCQKRYERIHHHWRERYAVGADDHSMRPKRRGIDVQQLRANAALCIEWLLINVRNGWLGTPSTNPHQPIVDDGTMPLRRLQARRLLEGLHKPYGAAAVALGIGRAKAKRLSKKELEARLKAVGQAPEDSELAAA